MSAQTDVVYFNEVFPASYSVLMYFQEKKIEFEAQRIDILAIASTPDESGEVIDKVPMLKKRNTDVVYIGAEKIFEEYVGTTSNEIFLTQLEELMEELAFAVCLAPENVAKSQLRWPFHDRVVRQNFVKYILHTHSDFRQWLEKYSGGREAASKHEYDIILSTVESTLNQAEKLLSEENRLGIWIGGMAFSMADCRFTAMLVGLYQLGLEDLWSDGERPHLSMYVNQAFQRESVLLATKWKENESKVFYLDQEDEQIKSARYASYLAMGLAGIYIAKKALKW